MAYPNTKPLNIIIPQTSGSKDLSDQYPFEERIISGSRLILQTTTDGTLTGSSDLNINSITASNISASGYVSASSLNVVGATTLAGLTGTTATFSGLVSASAGLTASAIQDAGTLSVVGATTLAGLTATTATFSGLVSASAGLTASAIQDAGTLSVIGNSTLKNTYLTNLTASNISASGVITSSGLHIMSPSIGEISSNDAAFDLLRYNVKTLNFALNGTEIIIGSGSGYTLVQNQLIAGSISSSTNIISSDITASNISASGYISSSALYVSGSEVIGNNLIVRGGKVYLFNSTDNDLSAYDIGALQIAGGVGIAKNLYVGADSYTVGNSSITGSLTVNTTLRVNGNSILGDNLTDVNTSSGSLKVLNATQATDYNVGALTVVGGVGIGKNLYVSGSTWLYGDLNIFGSSSVTYISSSTVIINDNIIQLNAYVPFERYAGFEVYDSGSNQRSASLLWDGQADNWITVDQNNTSSNIILGPTSSFGNEPGSLTANNIPKAYDATGITTSSLSDDGTTLAYVGTTISSSKLLATTGSITYITGALVTYVTGSFTTITIATGSNPGAGAVPSTPTAAGMPGQINVDNNFIYVYTNNIWKRVPISNWSV